MSTQGLKWDFGMFCVAAMESTELILYTDWLTSFDTQISTSNHLLPENPTAVITTSRPVYWTMEIR